MRTDTSAIDHQISGELQKLNNEGKTAVLASAKGLSANSDFCKFADSLTGKIMLLVFYRGEPKYQNRKPRFENLKKGPVINFPSV
jgi:hypothetical protein